MSLASSGVSSLVGSGLGYYSDLNWLKGRKCKAVGQLEATYHTTEEKNSRLLSVRKVKFILKVQLVVFSNVPRGFQSQYYLFF